MSGKMNHEIWDAWLAKVYRLAPPGPPIYLMYAVVPADYDGSEDLVHAAGDLHVDIGFAADVAADMEDDQGNPSPGRVIPLAFQLIDTFKGEIE